MDMCESVTCQSLIKWFQTLDLKAPHSNAQELSDGVGLAEALNQFAPEFFSDHWFSKIKTDVGSNWRLKMSNLKKVIEGMYNYYSDILNYSLMEFPRPEAQRIAESCDVDELERVLQLALGCAVNCPTKQNYIRKIMCLEEALQANIMKVLQELESTWQGTADSTSIMNYNYKIIQERDQLAQKVFEAEKKISLLIEEKANLRLEISKLKEIIDQRELSSSNGPDGIASGSAQQGSDRYHEMRRQLDNLKEELLQSETTREDLKLKFLEQENKIKMMQQRIDEFVKTTGELTQLKDEVDILRESNEKLLVCEAQVNSYKRKLEDYNYLKKQIKILEERSAEYVQQNAQFEEDAKKHAALKRQVEIFKKEIQDLHAKLDKEVIKNAKIEFDNKNMGNTINVLCRTKENLLKERDNLRETIDELKCGQFSTNLKCVNLNTISKELQPDALLEKLQRLEAENVALREGQGGQTALVQLLDNANKRSEYFREQLKFATERIMALSNNSLNDDNKNDDATKKGNDFVKQVKQLMELNEQKTQQLTEIFNQNAELQVKVSQLENALASREQEFIICDTRYRKCAERAKEIIKHMEPRAIHENIFEVPETMQSKMTKMEEELILAAFYRFATNAHRDAIDSKLALLMGSGQTFLIRQRQSTPRKCLAALNNN